MAGGTLTIAGALAAASAFGSASGDDPAVVITDGAAAAQSALLNAPPAAPLDATATSLPATESTELAPGPTDVPAAPPAPTEAPPVATPVPPTAVPPRVPPTPAPTQAPAPPASVALHPLEQAMFAGHNAQRSGAGLPGFTLDARLTQVARQRAQDMATRNYFSHTSPSGETAFTILDQIGYAYQLAGENIARNNYPDSDTVQVSMTGFMNSPSHRGNILEPAFRRIGIGVAFAPDGMKYFAVTFSN